MTALICEMVDITEEHLQEPIKMRKVSASPGTGLTKEDGEIMDKQMFWQSFGKIMYLTNKLFIEEANSARELLKYFMSPKLSHWSFGVLCWLFEKSIELNSLDIPEIKNV